MSLTRRFLIFVAMCFPTVAWPQSMPAPTPNMGSHPAENGEMLEGSKAIAWTLTYNSDLNANISGGQHIGSAYLQRVGLIADADLDRLIGWRGAKLHGSVHAISGRGLSAHNVGNILTVSGIEAEPALRLFNLWVEQSLPRGGSLRTGQFTAGQEFMLSSTAALFINSTFGWPASFATDLPSGGPAYPLAAPASAWRWIPVVEPRCALRCSPATPQGPAPKIRSSATSMASTACGSKAHPSSSARSATSSVSTILV
jgi:porin